MRENVIKLIQKTKPNTQETQHTASQIEIGALMRGENAGPVHYLREEGKESTKPQLKPGQKVTDQQLIEAHAKGFSLSQAAGYIGGIGLSTVGKRWKKLKLVPHFEAHGTGRPELVSAETLREAHSRGLSQTEAAKALGVTVSAVSYRWKSLKLKPMKDGRTLNSRRPLKVSDAALKEVYMKGYSINEASRELNVTYTCVWGRWKKMGLVQQKARPSQ